MICEPANGPQPPIQLRIKPPKAGAPHTEKDLPQPQEPVALGLW